MSKEIEIEKLTIGEKLTTKDVDTTDIKIDGVSIKDTLARLPEKWVNTINGQGPDEHGDVKVIAKHTYIPYLGIAMHDEDNPDAKDYVVLGTQGRGLFVGNLKDKTAFRPSQSLPVTSKGKDVNIPVGYGRLHAYGIGKTTAGDPMYAMTNTTKNCIEVSKDLMSWDPKYFSSNGDSVSLYTSFAYGKNPYSDESFWIFNGQFKHTNPDAANANNIYLTKDFSTYECLHISTQPTVLHNGQVFYLNGKFYMFPSYSRAIYELKFELIDGGKHSCTPIKVADLPNTHDVDINMGNSVSYRVSVDEQTKSAFFGVNGSKTSGGSLAAPHVVLRFKIEENDQCSFDYTASDYVEGANWTFPKECRGGVTRLGEKLYLGTRTGHLYESADGASWRLVTQFTKEGNVVEIVNLFVHDGKLHMAGFENAGFYNAAVAEIEVKNDGTTVKFIDLNVLSDMIMDI